MMMLAALVLATTLLHRVTAKRFLFAFGDSYTATGFDVNGVQPSPENPLGNPGWGFFVPNAPGGTWSGGPNYIDFLTTELNSSCILTYDFAFPGATVDNAIVSVSPSIPDFRQQVANFWMPHYGVAGREPAPWTADNAVFSIGFGINDALNLWAGGAGSIPRVLDSYFVAVQQLFDAGARKFLFMGIPPVDRSPAFGNNVVMSDYINGLNGQLAQRVNDFSATHPEAQISIHDFHAFMTNVLDNPAAFGLQDASCQGDGNSACVWWAPTNVHTTSFFQQHLAHDVVGRLNALGF